MKMELIGGPGDGRVVEYRTLVGEFWLDVTPLYRAAWKPGGPPSSPPPRPVLAIYSLDTSKPGQLFFERISR